MKKIIFILSTIIIILTVLLFKENIIYNEIKYDDIYVEIKGAVMNPGVYKVDKGDRVSNLIDIAGGTLDNADTSTLNLSKELKNEMIVYIYTDSEIDEMRTGSTSVKYIERTCTCPILENDACIEDVISNNSIDNKTGLISINTATLEELKTLPGIGESKAKLIIEYRNNNGGFKSIEEIMKVKGIGDAMFKKIKDYIML